MVNNNNYKVEGAKAGDKPRQPNIAKDSVSSISTAKILYGLNDGEISGIVGGGKGIKLEDTPLLDEAGKENFKGVKWDFRAGTLDQEYIEGFPDISNETGVGVELKGGVDWIKAISNPVLSAVRIRLSWNGLRKQNTENGDVSGYKIDYAIDVKTGSGAYIEVLKTNINDKVTGKYERTHRIALPKSSSGWQIRVRRLTPNANLDNVQDKMFIESITEVIDQKFTYPHTSLLGIQYDAKTFSRIAKLAVRCKGKLIKIPSNYDTTSNTYTGVWNGQFKLEYSNNPAWIFYDLVTSKRYGLGKRIDPSMVDKWSLYDLGAYCDALVPDGQGSTEKRYTCNVYLQSQVEAYQILSQLSGIFRAITYWSGQQLVLSADVPKDPTYTFSRANVIDGQFEYTGTRARDRHTVAKVAFDNPKENYKTEYEYIRDEAGIAKFGINVIDISAIGCTSRGQAQRAGLWALKSEQLETRTVTFRTGLEGFNILVGEVIEVSDELLAGRANGGRITAVDSTFKKVTVDREAVIKVNDFITVNAKDGNSQRRKVTAVSGKVITVLTPFVGIESGAVWVISSSDLTTMQFRVMSVKPDEDNIFAITAIQHEPLKYAAVDTGASVKPTNISIIKPTNVAPPASVSLSANYRVVQGQSVATLVIQWSQVKDAVGYSVEWRRNDGNWIKLPLTGNVSAEVEGVYEGNYQARVKSVNAFDVESDFTNSIITNIKGKVGNPKALASISATGILFGMDIKWNFLAGSEDTNYTEIQTATDASGSNTALLGSFSYPTDKTTVNGLQGGLTVFYRGRIVDKLGNYSAWSNWISGTTDNNAGKVLEILTGQITESQLYKDLNTKIDKIGTNSTAIGGINTGLDKAKADIIEANNVITANKLEASNAVTAANTKITESKALIDANKAKLVLTDAEVAAAKTKVTALETDYNGNKVTVSNTLTALANKDTSFSQDLAALTTDYNGNKTSVSSSLTALTNKDTALGQQLTALDTDYKGNKTTVSNSLTSLTNADTALGSRITTLDTDYKGNKTAVTNSLTALSNQDTALTNSLNALTTRVGNNTSAISTEATTRTNADNALSTRIDTVTATAGTNKTSISTEITARTTADTALGNRITATDSIAKNAQSRVGTVETTVAAQDTAIAQTKTDLVAAINSIDNFIINGDETVTNATYSIKSYTLSRLPVAGDTYKITLKGTLGADRTDFRAYTNGGGNFLAALTPDADGDYTASFKWSNRAGQSETANKTLNIYQFVNGKTSSSTIDRIEMIRDVSAKERNEINAAITAVNTASVAKDVAITNTVNTLTTKVGTNTTSISNESTARSTADTALGNRITATDAIAKNAQSRVGTTETALATANSSIATLRQDLVASYTIADTRNTDELPQYYYSNFPRQTVQEFKTNSKFTGVIGAGTYIFLETNVKYSDISGGSITQKAITDDNRFYIRMSKSATAWNPWLEQEDVVGSAAKVEAARKALDTKIGATDARVTAEKKVASDATSALASTVNTLQTSVEESTVLFFYNLGRDHVNWNKDYSGAGESTATSTVWTIGNNSGNDQRWLIRNANIPLIDGQIYRISCKYRNVSGTGATYVGVAGIAANGSTWVAANGSNNPVSGQYYVDSDNTTSTALDEAYGYICSAGTDTTGMTGVKKLHASCQFFRPLLITNFPNLAGSTQFDWFKVEAVDKTNTASIQTAQKTINGISAQYTVKLDVGGRVSGFGLASAVGQTSDFAVNADKFYIAPPSGTAKGVSPFMVLTSAKTINGVSVPAGTYIEAAHIHNGSIDIAKIRTASITSLQALTANIGHFKSAPTGARLEIKDSLLSVYDANNKLRVRLGLW